MQAQELAKVLFQGTEVRILGTSERPLFIASEIGELLGMGNVRSSIAKFEDYKKEVVHNVDTPSGKQSMTALTEAGLYALILKSRKPVAKEFERWVLTEVLPTIRKTGNYNLQENINKQLEQQLEESHAEIERLKSDYKPVITYHELDINDFTNQPCVYMFHLKDNDYKFGVSGEIDIRHDSHMRSFTKAGCTPKLIKVWKCESMQIMKDTESKIKLLAKQNSILTTKYGKKEIICTDNINHVVSCIDKYVVDQNNISDRTFILRKMELENENLRLQIRLTEMKLCHSTKLPKIIAEEVTYDDEQDNIASIEEDSKPFILPVVADNPASGKEIARQWIRDNPPEEREITTDYYRRYANSNTVNLHNNQFGKLVIESGFVKKSNGNKRYWIK